MLIRLSGYTSIEAADVLEVRVHGQSGTVSVRMADGVIHHCPNDLGRGAWETAERLAKQITRYRMRAGKPECRPVPIAA